MQLDIFPHISCSVNKYTRFGSSYYYKKILITSERCQILCSEKMYVVLLFGAGWFFYMVQSCLYSMVAFVRLRARAPPPRSQSCCCCCSIDSDFFSPNVLFLSVRRLSLSIQCNHDRLQRVYPRRLRERLAITLCVQQVPFAVFSPTHRSRGCRYRVVLYKRFFTASIRQIQV